MNKDKKVMSSLRKRRLIIYIDLGIINIQSSYNNTILTISNNKGKVLYVTSTGIYGFKHTKKGTPFAAYTMTEKALQKIQMKSAKLIVKGPGIGKEAVLRVLKNKNITILKIYDMNELPYNGCRSPYRRRV
uniref:ribosomal protein S11 n=1 Tax=Hydnora esculenta TaxID=1851369 RepID=UPI002115C693|nr:ribosomal protein S11 [Hydnora esculenta]USN93640.1 ribosomal protein S11 [Hydnora esculenta]